MNLDLITMNMTMLQYLLFGLQLATLIAVYANWSFAAIEGIGWGWAGIVWLYNLIFYIPLDFIKFIIRYALSGRAWDLVFEQRVCILDLIDLTCLSLSA